MSELTSTPTHIAKNITIGVITSVLAAVLIYYTIGNPKKAEFAKKKEATKKAWTSYKENRAVFIQALKSIDTAMDDERAKKLLNHQIDIAVSNMENIKKETDADQRVFSTVDITIEQIKEMKPLFESYFNDRANFINKNPEALIDNPYLVNLQKNFAEDMSNLRTRDTLRLNTFRDGLIKDYGVE
jgi:hypothetical protein